MPQHRECILFWIFPFLTIPGIEKSRNPSIENEAKDCIPYLRALFQLSTSH
jgi:hypothetical protein